MSVIGMFAPSTGNLNNITLDHMKMYVAFPGDTYHYSFSGGYPGVGNRPVQSRHTGVPFSRTSVSGQSVPIEDAQSFLQHSLPKTL